MLLSRLKWETREAHERIERDLDLLSDGLTFGRYVTILARFHGFLRAWEPRIAHVLDDEAFFGPRRKLALAEADLAALALPPLPPRAVPLGFLTDRASAMGSLYVLEGATLGGQLITRHVQRVLGLGDAGTAFFRSYGRDVGPRWQAFRLAMEALSSPRVDDAVVAGAQSTFRALNQVLTNGRTAPAPLEARAHA